MSRFPMMIGVDRSTCNSTARAELEVAGIPALRLFASRSTEVECEYLGQILGNWTLFIFRRGADCWMVDGFVPLEVAQKLYDDPIGKSHVRVNGDDGNTAPEKRARPALKETNYNRQEFLMIPVEGAPLGISHYSIDTSEGLALFVETLRREELISPAHEALVEAVKGDIWF
jgi:hypothetical protein